MRLTKKRAIELTLELWMWLYENPGKYKSDWPGWKDSGGIYETVDCECFACEHAFATIRRCKSCVLLPLWPQTCTSGDNVYANWNEATTDKAKKKYAKQIVDFCKKELAK